MLVALTDPGTGARLAYCWAYLGAGVVIDISTEGIETGKLLKTTSKGENQLIDKHKKCQQN